MKNNIKMSELYKERIDIIALVVSAVFGILIGGCLMFLFLSGPVDIDTQSEQNIHNNLNVSVSSTTSSNT